MVWTLDDWLQQNSDRVLARQRAQVDAAKVLASITVAVAATLVATALQVGDRPRGWDFVAVYALTGTFILTVAVILLDRLKEPNRLYAQDRAQRGKWTDAQLLKHLVTQTLDAEYENHIVVNHVRIAALMQVLICMITCAAATLSLLT